MKCLNKRLDQRAEFFVEYEKGYFPPTKKGITNYLKSTVEFYKTDEKSESMFNSW